MTQMAMDTVGRHEVTPTETHATVSEGISERVGWLHAPVRTDQVQMVRILGVVEMVGQDAIGR
jgi:hypothetical protein